MSKQGTYNVQGTPRKDTSFKSFICALLVFLALIIIIYLILTFAKKSAPTEKESEPINNASKSEKFIINAFEPAKESTTWTKISETTTLSTKVQHYPNEENNVPTVTEDKTNSNETNTEIQKKKVNETGTSTGGILKSIDGKDNKTKITPNPPGQTTETTVIEDDECTECKDLMTSSTDKTSNGESQRHGDEHGENTTPTDKEDKVNYVPSTEAAVTDNTEETSPKISDTHQSIVDKDDGNTAVSYDVTTDPLPITNTETNSYIYENTVTTVRGGKIYPDTTTEIPENISSNIKLSARTNDVSETTTDGYEDSVKNLHTTQLPNYVTVDTGIDDSLFHDNTTENINTALETSSFSGDTTVKEATTEYATLRTNFVTPFNSSAVLFSNETEISTTEIYIQSTNAVTKIRTPLTTYSATTTEEKTTENYSTPWSAINNAVRTTAHQNVTYNECISTLCKKSTSNMLDMMNHGAEPCEDFYEFACGGQQSDEKSFSRANFETLLTSLHDVETNSSEYMKIFANFYGTCVQHEREFKFTERLTFLEQNETFSVTELFVELVLTQQMPLFDIGLDIGKDQFYEFQLTLPGSSSLKTHVNGWTLVEQIKQECLKELESLKTELDLSLDVIYSSYKSCEFVKTNTYLQNFIDEMSNLQLDNQFKSWYNDTHLINLIYLLDKIKEFVPSEIEIQQAVSEKVYETITVKTLNMKYDVIDWKLFLEGITSNRTFNDDDSLQIYFPNYFDNIFDVLKDFDSSDLIMVFKLYSSLQLYKNTVIPKEKENRGMYCMELSNQLMPDIVTIITYEEARKMNNFHLQYVTIKGLFTTLQSNLDESISKSKLDESVKATFQKKLNKIKLGLITTGNYNSTSENYKHIQISPKDSYPKIVLTLLRNFRNITYSLVKSKATAASLLTYFVNPFYSYPKAFYPSEFVVFHPTMFKKSSMELPDYIRLSKTGLHLSRELAKQFDPVGRHYMTDQQIGSSDDFYSFLVKKTTNLLTTVYMKNPYTFQGQDIDLSVNTSLPINEMIVDNTAFRLIYDSFNKLSNLKIMPWISQAYSKEKVFFIAAAQEYCKKTTILDFMQDFYEFYRLPSPLKIQNVVSNSKEFSVVFNCPEGSAMKLDHDLITQFPYIDYDANDYYTYDGNNFSIN